MTNQPQNYHPITIYNTDTIEDLECLARDAYGWARVYANAGDLDRARIEREAAESFVAEIARRAA